MGNTHDTEIARIEADHIQTKWRTTEDYRWGYSGDRGPETWWVHYPSASGGMQSPVDIITEETRIDMEFGLSPLQICYHTASEHGLLSEGHVEETKILINTGNTARINVVNSKSYITGGPCKGYSYVLEQFHLHWGENDNNGSEHHVNSLPFSAEVHLVHWNEDLYTSYAEAARSDDGILIMAVFVQLSENRNNDCLVQLSQMLEDVVYREQNIPIVASEFQIKSLLPDNLDKYWTYQGSYSTPPCYETVTWIVFEKPINLSSKALNKFRTLRCYCENEARPEEDYDGEIKSNRRPCQPIGTRKIATVDCSLFRGHGEQPFRGQTVAVRLATFQDYLSKHRRDGLAGGCRGG